MDIQHPDSHVGRYGQVDTLQRLAQTEAFVGMREQPRDVLLSGDEVTHGGLWTEVQRSAIDTHTQHLLRSGVQQRFRRNAEAKREAELAFLGLATAKEMRF